MNPLPRLLGMGLLVILAALVALLAAPAWRELKESAPAQRTGTREGAASASAPAAIAPAARMEALGRRAALGLALAAFALAVLLIFSLALRATRPAGTMAPFASTRGEMKTLAKLAESSVAQGAELSRERDVRRRAEEDAQLKQELLRQSVDEKIRLGRDLHDGIIQSMYAVGLTLETVRALVKSDPDEADRRLEQTRASLNDAIRDVRAYITGLAPENLRRGGFAQALNRLLVELRAGREAQFEIRVDDDAAALLTPEQSVQVLQIAREAVSNALRHGRASAIAVRVHQGDNELCLLVQDNGAGFNPAGRRDGGHGLANMKARAERLGSTLRVTSEPAKGTRIVATFPIIEPAAV